MDEAVGAADVHEDPEVADAGDCAGLDVAFLKLVEEAFLLGGALFLDGGALREEKRAARSEEHTSELQSRPHLVCRLLLEKKKKLLIIIVCIYNFKYKCCTYVD